MERQLLERMIGAGVLLVALVVIVPAILDGRPDIDDPSQSSLSEPELAAPEVPLRQHTIRLDEKPESPPVALHSADVAQVAQEPGVGNSTPEPKTEPKMEPKAKVAVAAAPVPEPESKDPVAVAPKPKPKPKPEPKVVVAKATKPVQPEAAPPAQASTMQPGWVVQLGSFSSQANAKGLADKTRAQGFQSYLMSVERSGKTLYRVRVGPSRKTRGEAAKLVDDLRKAGFNGQVVEQKVSG